jgi:hypothetical protein
LSKESFKQKLDRWFPTTKEMTEKQLHKEIKSDRAMQLIFLATALLFVSTFAVVPFNKLEVFQRMAFLGVIVAGIAVEFALYAQFRVAEVEAKFELRLRETFKDAKDWQA